MTPPLSKGDMYLVVESVAGTHSVLVGGQAVALWAERYPIARAGAEVFVSSDVDFLGGADEAEVCAKALGGFVVVEQAPFDSIPITAAKVVFTDSAGHERVVDFLINLSGVKRASDVLAKAVTFEHSKGKLFVMDPFNCLRTRLANICRLHRTDAKSLAQARTALRVLREWLVDPEVHAPPRGSLRWIESVFSYAERDPDARDSARLHQIDAFDAVRPHAGLPSKFNDVRYPQMRAKISSRRSRDASSVGA